jgi:hypothetical protein
MLSKSWLLSLPLALGVASAWGGDFTDMFTYNGFGTAGVVKTDNNKAMYVETGQSAGSDGGVYFKTDSKLGLQGTVTPTAWLSGTVQVLAADKVNDNLSPTIEWAFVKFKPLSGLSIRAGRMALPSYLVSDSRNVGYANTWLRAPDEVYGQGVFDTFTGADIAYQHSIGAYSLTLGALAGKTEVDVFEARGLALMVIGRNVHGYSAALDAGFVTLRYSHVAVEVTAELDGFIYGNASYSFSSIGATLDRNNVVAQAEFIAQHAGATEVDVDGWYTLGGYRLGNWLPYAMYAAGQRPPGPSASNPVFGNPGGTPLPSQSKHTISVGVRADLIKSVDFKLQVDRETTFPTGAPFINVQPGFDDKAFVYSFAVDFVF